MVKLKNTSYPLLIACLLWCTWGLNFVMVKVGLDYCGAYTYSFWRTIIGLLPIFAFLLYSGKLKINSGFFQIALLGLLQTGAFTIFAALALINGSAGKTSILIFTMPFWVTLFSFFLGRTYKMAIILINILAFAGLMMMLTPWKMNSGIHDKALAIAGAISLAVSTMLIQDIYRKIKIEPLTLVFWQMLIGCIPLLIGYLLIQEPATKFTAQFVWSLLYSSVISNAVSWPIWFFLLKILPDKIASLNILAVPAFGLIFSSIFLHEQITKPEAIGIILIFISLILVFIYDKVLSNKNTPTA